MSMYQALYETICNELKELEEKLSELYKKKENIKNDLEKTEEILWEQEYLLSKLETERDYMPYRNKFKISIYAGMLALIGFIFGISLYFYGVIKILLLFPTLEQGVISLILLFTTILGFLGGGLSCIKMSDKIQEKLEKKSIMKIINSNEYQQLLSKINTLENSIEVTRDNFSNKSKDYKLANENYQICKKDRDEKNLLKEYINKHIIPSETTLHIVKEYKRDYCGDNSCSCY